MSAEADRAPRAPWRDGLEAVVLALSVALLFKHFAIEVFKIPTPSMQPTLFGSAETGLFDRILVDKLAYRWREPERWEVAIFRFPLDRSKTFVKRIVGLPGEDLRISLGDVWVRPGPAEPWRIPRRPRAVLESTWKRLEPVSADEPAWRISAGQGRVEPRRLALDAGAQASFGVEGDSIVDRYDDGYPEALRGRVPDTYRGGGANPVGDVRLTARVAASPECRAIEVELREGALRYRFRVPGPALEGEPPRIEVDLPSGGRSDASGSAPPGERFELEVANVDDRLELWIDGELAASLEIAPQLDQSSAIALRAEGGPATFEDLAAWRDVFYTEAHKVTETRIPERCYFVLGDNTQDSADSREWTFRRYRLTDPASGAVVLRAHARPGENPFAVAGAPAGPELWLRDEHGERHCLLQEQVDELSPEQAPFVPRDALQGRAFAVFWPIAPRLGVWRVGSIR